MKRQKHLIVLIIMLVLSVVNSITIYASFEISSADTITNTETTRKGVQSEKMIAFADKSSKTLSYSITENVSSTKYNDIYLDKEQNRYFFNESEKFLGFVAGDFLRSKAIEATISKTKGGNGITEEEAIQIAKKYSFNLYGKGLDNLILNQSLYKEDTQLFSIEFAVKYGEEDFITGQMCYVNVFADGTVYSCIMPDMYDISDFNDKTLTGLTKKSVLDYINKQINAVYSTSLIDYTINGIYLVNKNGNYGLEILVGVELKEENSIDMRDSYMIGETLFYEIV